MTFTVNDAYLPATLTAPNMSDEEFAEFCATMIRRYAPGRADALSMPAHAG